MQKPAVAPKNPLSRRPRHVLLVLLAALVALPASAIAHEEENAFLAPQPTAAAEDPGQHSANLSLVKNIPYEARNGGVANYGTDIEFAEIGGTRYAFAGSYKNGMQIVDISDPRNAQTVAVYDCAVTQGDVQIFRQDDEPGRVFATYTSDTFGNVDSACYREAAALGFDVRKNTTSSNNGKNGSFVVDITDPRNPRTVSFAAFPQGSHNMTVHPSGDFLYNSNSDLMTSVLPAIEITDISDPSNPRPAGELALPTRPGLGTESHDITFNEDGSRAYSAALSQGVIIDTTNPGQPKMVTSFLDPTINVWHQSDPVTIGDREFLVVEDEFAGAIGTGQCPNGGVHVYDITGAKEKSPEKVGYWNIDDIGATASPTNSCTAHVFDIHEDEQIMTIAFYNGGVRVVDLSGLEGVALGDTSVVEKGMQEIAFFRTGNADTWSAKTPRIEKDGDFFLYGNDINRGLDIYRFEAEGEKSKNKGTWKNKEEAESLPKRSDTSTATPLDLLREGS